MSNKKISSSSSFKNKALQKELLIVLLIYSQIEKWLNCDKNKPLYSYKGNEDLRREIPKGEDTITDLTIAKIY